MTTRQVLIVGGIVGLLVSSAVLALLWFGVAGALVIGNTDLMYVFWPSSVMLLTGWRQHDSGHDVHSILCCDQLLAVHGICICAAPVCAARSQVVNEIRCGC